MEPRSTQSTLRGVRGPPCERGPTRSIPVNSVLLIGIKAWEIIRLGFSGDRYYHLLDFSRVNLHNTVDSLGGNSAKFFQSIPNITYFISVGVNF